MALGGSFPELLTATIGLFLGEGGMQAGSGTKIGSIVGSAVFNILFVINDKILNQTKRKYQQLYWVFKVNLFPYLKFFYTFPLFLLSPSRAL